MRGRPGRRPPHPGSSAVEVAQVLGVGDPQPPRTALDRADSWSPPAEEHGSRPSGPAQTSHDQAASATVRGHRADVREAPRRARGVDRSARRTAWCPKMPANGGWIRIEPPPSVPRTAIGPRPRRPRGGAAARPAGVRSDARDSWSRRRGDCGSRRASPSVGVVGLADHDGMPAACSRATIGASSVGDVVGEEPGPERRPHALGDDQVLHRRTAPRGAALSFACRRAQHALGRARRPPRLVVGHGDVRVDLRIQPADSAPARRRRPRPARPVRRRTRAREIASRTASRAPGRHSRPPGRTVGIG